MRVTVLVKGRLIASCIDASADDLLRAPRVRLTAGNGAETSDINDRGDAVLTISQLRVPVIRDLDFDQ